MGYRKRNRGGCGATVLEIISIMPGRPALPPSSRANHRHVDASLENFAAWQLTRLRRLPKRRGQPRPRRLRRGGCRAVEELTLPLMGRSN